MSDLLVREFDIPKPGKYTAALQIYEDGAAVLEVTWTRPFEKPRSTTRLPIMILPKGHGRLIDGELLWGKLLDALANAKTIVPAEGGTKDGA